MTARTDYNQDQSIRDLQTGIISKPGLMQSVCKEYYRLQSLPGPDKARRDRSLRLRDGRMKRHRSCTCKLKRNETDLETSSKRSHFDLTSSPKWKVMFETESIHHHRTCPLFADSSSTTVAKFRIGSCGTLLARAIEASISITRGAGGLSISPVLRCAHVVPRDNPAFRLVNLQPWDSYRHAIYQRLQMKSKIELEELLDINIQKLERLFRAGEASPYDVDLAGNTLLHVRVTLLPTSCH